MTHHTFHVINRPALISRICKAVTSTKSEYGFVYQTAHGEFETLSPIPPGESAIVSEHPEPGYFEGEGRIFPLTFCDTINTETGEGGSNVAGIVRDKILSERKDGDFTVRF